MSEEDLKNLWKAQPAPAGASEPGLAARVREKTRKMDRTLFWRDSRELVACFAVVLWMAIGYHHAEPPLQTAGRIVVVLSCVLIASILVYTRFGHRPRVTGVASLRDHLAEERRKIAAQIKLLRSVLWWYLLPLLTGYLLYFWGAHPATTDRLVDLAVFALVGGALYWANLYAARRSLEPLQKEIEATISEIPHD